MSVPSLSPLAAALRTQLSAEAEILLAGLEPALLASERTQRATPPRPKDQSPDPQEKPAPPSPERIVETARQTAAGRQQGLAQLLADLELALKIETLPAPVRAAAARVLSHANTPEALAKPETLKAALSRSGLFLEPRLARAPASPPPPDLKTALLTLRQVLRAVLPPTPAAPPPSPAPAPPPPAQGAPVLPATAPMRPEGRQTAPLPGAAPAQPAAPPAQTYARPPAALPELGLPDLPDPPAGTRPATPSQPQTKPAGAAQTPTPAQAPPSPAGAPPLPGQPAPAQTAPQTTSPPTGAQSPLPTAASPPPPAGAPAPPPQAQTALQPPPPGAPPLPANTAVAPQPQAQPQGQAQMQSPASTGGSPVQGEAPPAAQAPGPGAALARPGPAPARPTAPPAPPAAGLPHLSEGDAPEAPRVQTSQTASTSGRERAPSGAQESPPPPPVKGAAPEGQKAARPALPLDADPAAMVRHLERATTGALARQELFQLASLPDAPRADGEAPRGPSWLFEVPVATQNGPAVAQFEIERDGSNGEADAEGRTWRTRFSIDIEPLGLIHALLVLAGGHTSVTLWAERPGTLERLRRDQAELASSLEAEVAVHQGRPSSPAARPGRFLDASS